MTISLMPLPYGADALAPHVSADTLNVHHGAHHKGYVTKVNGEAVTPFWADTLPVPSNGSITFRMRFTDFSGKYVWHCHALNHEDLGMMQLVDVVGA